MDKRFGKKAKDKITGFEGIIIGKTSWMFGCSQYCLSPAVDKDGKKRESEWFDKGRIEIIDDGISPDEVQDKVPGGINDHPCESRR